MYCKQIRMYNRYALLACERASPVATPLPLSQISRGFLSACSCDDDVIQSSRLYPVT